MRSSSAFSFSRSADGWVLAEAAHATKSRMMVNRFMSVPPCSDSEETADVQATRPQRGGPPCARGHARNSERLRERAVRPATERVAFRSFPSPRGDGVAAFIEFDVID